ncbi:uncharacterized protein HMPREF1120_03175 [Exophiala dermatitidis NIH/UT8656]|uniref:Uncharacterized protein n=1 Tax=Exophiala dermatitidis (strain ATCC 34100 / CBS 525.76 / NIH/UT8656) TaxID=858893 RepID=H6BVA3_EXODN|nr:uncharacterized protein HMPREF1120_03175 [Exophiala dermatitidis NIH/UT8656]EHY55017.1 hypothetical protein HMPREF1120_03175 [Exophiala dermatitidis NIH/UT8656]
MPAAKRLNRLCETRVSFYQRDFMPHQGQRRSPRSGHSMREVVYRGHSEANGKGFSAREGTKSVIKYSSNLRWTWVDPSASIPANLLGKAAVGIGYGSILEPRLT